MGVAATSEHGCGPECSYRALYEGSQSSLSDMAAKQAVALRRLGHFRAEVVRMMKRSWPHAFRSAEQRAGRRLTELPDDVVLAYLDTMMRASPEQLDRLRDRLTQTGLTLPVSDDLEDWIGWLAGQEPDVGPGAVQPASTHGTLVGLFGDEGGEVVGPEHRPVVSDPPPETAGVLGGLFGPAADGDQGEVAGSGEEAGGSVAGELAPPPEEPLSSDVPPPGRGAVGEVGPVVGPPMDAPVRTGTDRVRPEPQARQQRKRSKKVPRTRAQAPDPARFDVPPEQEPAPGGEVDEDTHNALLAAVAIPRPVFTSDLVSVAGSQQAVGVWEREMRKLGTEAPVRFIPSKSRHQARGSLVLPHAFLREAASEFTRTWWAGCIERYRGSRLYELAVLLHRVGEDVVGYHLGEETVVLRLNQRRGLVGVVVVVGAELGESEPTRAGVVEDLEALFTERLSVVAVLPTRGDLHEALDRMLEEESQARQWSPAMPVVTATSWQWADSSGTAARAVLGGAV